MAERIDSIRSLLIGALLALAAASAPVSAQTEILDRVIAIVDQDVILQSEYEQRLEQVQERLQAQGMEVPDEELMRQELLERLIVERIQLNMGERAGVRFSDAEINQAMSNIAAQSGLTLEQFRLALEAEGESYASMREQVTNELIINRVQQGTLRSQVQVTEQDIDNYLRSEAGQDATAAAYRAVHLLLPLSSDTGTEQEAQARAYLEELRGDLIGPGDFIEVLAEPPQQPYRLSGGDLGWRSEKDLPSIFVDVVPELNEGQLSEVFRSPSGLHLVKLLGKRGGSGQTVRQTSVRHILVSPSEIRTEREAETLARALRQRVLDGEDFGELAREFSEDYGSALAGGDLGWTNPGQMVPEFEAAMNATASGEISDVFRTQFGWHFLEVMERRDFDITEQMRRNQARNILYRERFDEELNLWLRKIRDEAFVEIKL
jgi:peptidyl-prolyl cis-trans isomerase SurA